MKKVNKFKTRSYPNIALIKYWGKYCITNNISLNSSNSITLNDSHLYTETTIEYNNV